MPQPTQRICASFMTMRRTTMTTLSVVRAATRRRPIMSGRPTASIKMSKDGNFPDAHTHTSRMEHTHTHQIVRARGTGNLINSLIVTNFRPDKSCGQRAQSERELCRYSPIPQPIPPTRSLRRRAVVTVRSLRRPTNKTTVHHTYLSEASITNAPHHHLRESKSSVGPHIRPPSAYN